MTTKGPKSSHEGADQNTAMEKLAGAPELKMKPIHGIMRRIAGMVTGVLIGAGISGAAGAAAGSYTQQKFREYTHYHPKDESEAVAPNIKIDDDEDEDDSTTAKNNEPKDGSYAAKAKALAKSALRTTEDIVEAANTKLKQKYNNLKERFNVLYKLLDKAAFWGPFAITFLAMAYTLDKIIAMKKAISGDAIVNKNLSILAENQKQIMNRLDLVKDAVLSGTLPPDQMKVLVEQIRTELAPAMVQNERRLGQITGDYRSTPDLGKKK